MTPTNWRGTVEEFKQLQKITQTYCNCERNAHGDRLTLCGPHLLLREQHVLDRLLFVRRMRDRFQTREFSN
jgi:hypothetical protein